jgi:hypothetical protein
VKCKVRTLEGSVYTLLVVRFGVSCTRILFEQPPMLSVYSVRESRERVFVTDSDNDTKIRPGLIVSTLE